MNVTENWLEPTHEHGTFRLFCSLRINGHPLGIVGVLPPIYHVIDVLRTLPLSRLNTLLILRINLANQGSFSWNLRSLASNLSYDVFPTRQLFRLNIEQ